ncbi:Transposase for transposon Tn5 [Gemmata sp. SH-PL17]|uniref:IS4 family transposase n=1 Tax=Gemmata sp. SH-PL17 TaxID=1630693 RepID=UPI00078C3FF2|nr:IS4 family transposase [Gemmata sp. SH-PL17]AMV26774.1 Transposase for transposon Tn5 [Gemmata sp. SH-PL17]
MPRAPSTRSQSWAADQFGQADLGDARRTARLVHSAACIHEHPGGSLPAKFHDPAALGGYYRLANEPDVTHAHIIRAAPRTWQRMRDETGVVLVLHDTTIGDYSGLSIEDLGQIGDGHGRGLYIHNALAVTPDRRVLGLAGQWLHKRRKVPKNETKAPRQRAPDRESRLWKRAVEQIPHAPAGRLWVDVADRGADVTEFLAHEHKAQRAYLVRSQHNRTVQQVDGSGAVAKARLHALIHTLMARACRTQEVQEAPGRGPRTAPLALAWADVTIVPPRQPRGDHDAPPLPVCAVRVWDVDPPAGQKGIEWILLTNVRVATESDAWARVDWYRARWVVEEYHKVMKTGVEIESLQFTTRGALEVTIGVLSVVAVSLLELRDLARDPQRASEPATHHVPRLWVVVLSAWRHARARGLDRARVRDGAGAAGRAPEPHTRRTTGGDRALARMDATPGHASRCGRRRPRVNGPKLKLLTTRLALHGLASVRPRP